MILFQPDYKDRIWGGDKLKTLFNKEIPNDHTGESWELACHDQGQSVVKNGPYKGMTLEQLLMAHGEEVIGRSFNKEDKFPLLIKLIDAKTALSVQVHPDDAYANFHENGELGKSECWIILQADPGASLVAGLKEGVSKVDFEQAIEQGQLEACLYQLPVKAGDVVNIPAGLIHAIGEGIVLAEVQQNSDTTYRVFDWNRVGLDGKPRELHVAKSLDVTNFDQEGLVEAVDGALSLVEDNQRTLYIINDYFVLERWEVKTSYKDQRSSDFEIYMVLSGQGSVVSEGEALSLKAGDTMMVPASVTDYEFCGTMSLLKTYVPKNKELLWSDLEDQGIDMTKIARG